MKKLLSTIVLVLAIAAMAFAKGPVATIVFTVEPKMTCQNCENKIKTNIRFEKGVTEIVTDIPSQTVKVTYEPAKTDTAGLVEAFKAIGYTATPAVSNAQTINN